MPAPLIKYPPGVGVSRRDRSITYTRPARGDKPSQVFGIVGYAYPHPDGQQWMPFYRDHDLARGRGRLLEGHEKNAESVPGAGPLFLRTQREAVRAVLKAQGFWPETCEVCQGPEPLLEQRCRTCIERRYKQVLREHGEALHKSGGRLGAVLSLRATPAYQGRVLAMVRIRKFLGIPEVEIGGRHA